MADSAARPGYADVKVVRALAKDMPDSFIQCRDLGHNWRPQTANETSAKARKAGVFYERILVCPRCETQRFQQLSRRGEVIRNSYTYPQGYETPSGTGRIVGQARDVLRITGLLRIVKGAGS
jgi:hypothetical protein